MDPHSGVMDGSGTGGEDPSGARLVPILLIAAVMTVTIMAILIGWSTRLGTAPEDDPAFTMAFTPFVFLQINALVVRSGDRSRSTGSASPTDVLVRRRRRSPPRC